MPLVAPNIGLPELLYFLIKAPLTGFTPWEMGLFENDYVPVQDTEFGDLVEPVWSGYSRVTLTRGDWLDPGLVGDRAVTFYDVTPVTWTCSSSGGYVFGYFIKKTGGDNLYIVERFAAPIPVTAGGQIAVRPRVTLTTEGLE